MRKKTLKVIDDFYKKDFKEGDIIGFFEGKVRVIDLNYQNEFGSFILCEYLDVEEKSRETVTNKGKAAHPDHPYEVVGTIHIPGYRNLLGGIGFFLKNRNNGEVLGLSFRQTWKLIFHEGAVNAEASASHSGIFHSKLIDSIPGLPYFDSAYWKIPAFDSNGRPFEKFTKEALAEIKKGMKYAVQNRVRDLINRRNSVSGDVSDLEQVAEQIQKAEKIVVLAGAGLSTSSGIPDYRSSAEGLWKKQPSLLTDLSQSCFERDPERFWQGFYELIEYSLSAVIPFPNHMALVQSLDALEPNNGHRFFSWLETAMGKTVTVITQNVDNLENKAGVKEVIQMHGNIDECICPTCKKKYRLTKVLKKNLAPRCECGSVLRPNVVFFGDQVHGFKEAKTEVKSADLLIIAGTSLAVYPFNELPYSENGAKTVLLNDSEIDNFSFDHILKGEISITSRKLQEILSKKVGGNR